MLGDTKKVQLKQCQVSRISINDIRPDDQYLRALLPYRKGAAAAPAAK